MKLSEFKAQYFPWSKEYKLREQKEAKEYEERYLAWKSQYHKTLNESAQVQLARAQAAQQQERYRLPDPVAKDYKPTATTNSFGDALLGSLVGNMVGNAIEHMVTTSESTGSSSSSSSWSSSSDSSSSWSDSSSSSWSDSGSSSWD